MKMHAQTTSERASKGQGGNKEIVINLKIKNNLEIGNLTMEYDKNTNKYIVYYYPINENCTDQKINSSRVLLYETKDKKLKMVKGCDHDETYYKYSMPCSKCGEQLP